MSLHRHNETLQIFAAALILAVPALWNGFPLLYWDSIDYMVMPFTHEIPPFRTASYSLMTMFAMFSGSLWAPVALQCLMTAFVLRETLDAFSPVPARRALLPVVVLLSVFTALPWMTGQLMADVFTGLVVLSAAVLAFAPPASRSRRVGLLAVTVLGVAVHTSHLALLAGLFVVFCGLRLAAMRAPALAPLRPHLAFPLAGLVLGGLLAGAANLQVSGNFHITQSNALLMFARTLQDGVGHRYLAEMCPQNVLLEGRPLRVCRYRNKLPHSANSFLWAPGPFYEMGGWTSRRMKEEAAFIVRDSIERYPLEHLRAAAVLTWQQFWMFKSGDGLVGLDTIHQGQSTTVDSMFMPRAVADYYPADLPAYWNSRQRYGIDMMEFNALHVGIGGLALLATAFAGAAAWRARDYRQTGLMLTVTLAVLGNAFVCGALSNPNDRYQARIVWTAVLACGLVGAQRLAAAVEREGRAGEPGVSASAKA